MSNVIEEGGGRLVTIWEKADRGLSCKGDEGCLAKR